MKVLIVLFSFTFSLNVTAQRTFAGRYHDLFGSRIELNTDSTFKFTFHFDLLASWTKGIWAVNKDTFYFKMIPVYDTVQYIKNNGEPVDSLILSVDEMPGNVTLAEATVLQTGGQNIFSYPDRLFYRNGRLYRIDSGKLIKKKARGIWGNKKYIPWFVKE